MEANLATATRKSKPKKKKSTQPQQTDAVDYLDALPWSTSFPNQDHESLSLFVGSDEGGFFSLEEINESDYTLKHGLPALEDPVLSSNSKKRKHGSEVAKEQDENQDSEKTNKKEQQQKKKKNRKRKKKPNSTEENASEVGKDDGIPGLSPDGCENSGCTDSGDYSSSYDDEFSAWNELRLHPLLVKSIQSLGFKEPTPIQKACIPAAAHQGKDVIGAAETGSGKTLAFGLPILQRLLEEREKSARLDGKEGNAMGKEIWGSSLRALIVTPTRELALQVSDHLKAVAKLTNVRVVTIVGGMSTEKQERLLRRRPEIIVGTPGRLWELMSGGETHLVELHSLSFFVLDEADRMIENGHFQELQSIIDILPTTSGHQLAKCSAPSNDKENAPNTKDCETVANLQRKKRQTFVFSATIALSADFRKKLKRGSFISKTNKNDEISSIDTLSERAGMRADAAIIDLTNALIMAHRLEESYIECKEEDKEAYLYYILSVHGRGRTIVFCTSIAALRRVASLLRILGITLWTLHAQMQQRARLKAIDHFRGREHGVLVATDVAARGLDVPGVRTVIHFQLPHSAEVYVHRSGRTARASTDGCSISLISPKERSKFASLCKSFSKESLLRFPLNNLYMPEVLKRLSLARQIDKISRKNTQEKAQKNWFEQNAESVGLDVENDDSEEERTSSHKQKKTTNFHLKQLQQELNLHLTRPLQPKTFSRRYLAGGGMSPLLQQQLREMASEKDDKNPRVSRRAGLLVIGQDCIEPLEALRSSRA